MNKDEMIIDMAEVITQASDKCLDTACEDCKYYRADDDYYRCKSVFEAEALYNAGYRKIADDEIVLNKEDYDKLCHLAYFGYEDVKQETAREILHDIEFYGVRSLNDKVWGNHFKLTDYTMLDLKMKYGIAKEKGIEFE